MAISTTYSALTTARAALAAALSSTESAADLARGRDLLDELDAAAASYTRLAQTFNAGEAIYAATQADYSTAVSALASDLASQTTKLDLSVRGAEQELVDASVSGAWAPGTASSPATFAVIRSRAEIAATACRTKVALVPIAEALDLQCQLVAELTAKTIPAPYQTSPTAPDTAWIDTLITKADRFREYLANY